MTERYVFAIDLGTTGLKVGYVTLAGKVVWTSGAQLTTAFGPDGAAEQDAEEWWRLVTEAARAGLASGVVSAEEVAAVSVTGQWASTVPVDTAGTPVAPCVLWMDTRGGRHTRRQIGGPVSGYKARALATWIRHSGGAPATSGADPIGHMLHLQRDRPDVAGAARWFIEPVDYLSMRFTGEALASPASMTGAWLIDTRQLDRLTYDDDLVRMAGFDATKLPPLRATGTVVGTVQDSVAADLGFPSGVAVVTGTPDLHSAAAGAGTLDDYRCHMAISTTSWISCPVGFKKTDPIRQIASVPGVRPGSYLIANNHETAGACLQWVRDQVIAPDPPRPEFGSLIEAAAASPPGCGGALFTPWLAGERSPIDDKWARAGFHNLSLTTDQPALIRAVLEGVAFNARWLHDAVERFTKRTLDPIRVFGGGAQGDLWCQIHADVMDRTVERLADPMHTGLRGAALLAGLALGAIDRSAAQDLVEVDRTFRPNAANREVYDRLYAEFTKLYKMQKGMFHRLNRPRRSEPGSR